MVKTAQGESYQKQKWLIFFRLLFTTMLLGSSIALQLRNTSSFLERPLVLLYAIIGGIFILSLIYSLALRLGRRGNLLAYSQVMIDTFIVTVIILVTGGYASVFNFLYLVVIIYSSMLLLRKGSMLTATLCSLQYGALVITDFYGLLDVISRDLVFSAGTHRLDNVVLKAIITAVACFAVAYLSSLLAEQTRRTTDKLVAMEKHVKRVERMAAVGEMAAGLAHEIKNPLASLSGSIQLLRGEVHFDPEYDRLMQIILREADRLNSLVSDFLLFARPPTGKVIPLDIGKALCDILDLFKNDAACRDRIELCQQILPDTWVQMDPTHVRQIFWNLLLNASEAIGRSGKIEIRMAAAKNEMVCIEIADNGCGIAPDQMKSIFNPFFTTKSKGTGLGLSVVHRILESYHGQLDVTSEMGKGAVFTLKLRQIAPSPVPN